MVEFEKVALFLVEEERRLLQALKEEEEATAARLRDSKACLDQQGHSLDLLLLQLEDRSQREPLQMLQVGQQGCCGKHRWISDPTSFWVWDYLHRHNEISWGQDPCLDKKCICFTKGGFV